MGERPVRHLNRMRLKNLRRELKDLMSSEEFQKNPKCKELLYSVYNNPFRKAWKYRPQKKEKISNKVRFTLKLELDLSKDD